MTDFGALLHRLNAAGVRFLIVGGAAAIAHGAARLTQDLDIVYDRSPENLAALANALRDLQPYPRGAPAGLPFPWDAETLRRGLNFTLVTALGEVNLLGEITGGGRYADPISHTDHLRVFDQDCPCLNLGKLIEVKRACGRPKDLEALAELEALWEEGTGE